jgi:hypothetical protein
MVVPIFASLDAVAAADTLRCVEQNTSWFPVLEPGSGHQVAVLLSQKFGGVFGHAAFFLANHFSSTRNVYHLLFAGVNSGLNLLTLKSKKSKRRDHMCLRQYSINDGG